jgi:PmbA protein
MDLSKHADDVERLLKGADLDSYEIMVSESRDLSVEAKLGKLDAFKCSEPFGVAVRVKRGEGLGFSFSTTLEPSALSRMVDGALVAARMQTPDPCNVLPQPFAHYPGLPDLLDPELARVPEEQKIACALELERLALSGDSRLKRVRKCSYGESLYGLLIRNSHGLSAGYRGSYVSLSVSVVAEAEGDAQIGWDFGFSNGLSGIDLEKIARGAGGKALSLLGARTIPSMRCQAVLDNRVATSILEVLAPSFLAENVHKGKSLFAGRLGERLFSELVAVRDNGVLAGGMGSAPCDGEGVPQQDTALVEGGVLKGFLYDSYWGNRMGAASTGNAVRAGVKGAPRMGVHNLLVEPGEHTLEEMLAGVGKGVLITDVMGMHTANPISGDFSVGATGFYLERGTVQHPVKGITIAGNLLELFKRVDMVADDLRFFGSAGSPALRIAELEISGS